MNRALVSCAGAKLPLKPEGWNVLILNHAGRKANVNLNIEAPSHALLGRIEPIASDLVKIASYVYAADQSIRRGGRRDLHGDEWQRALAMHVPVGDPKFWNDRAALLSETLNFLSGDRWSFQFSEGSPYLGQGVLNLNQSEVMENADSLYLLSGGLDSLGAVVEARAAGHRPVLVGHSPAFHVRNRRTRLIGELRNRREETWTYPYISVAVHRTGTEAKEMTQRTRSFLYGSLGLVFAERLGVKEFALADNGIVSLNLPINDQLVGAKASRSTHPKFIRLFNELALSLFRNAPEAYNPLALRTRVECIQPLLANDCAALIGSTYSCAQSRYLTRAQRHCGGCSQCVDRRFATSALGLERFDPPGGYVTDIFRDALTGDARTIAASYHRFALETSKLAADDMFERYTDLFDAVQIAGPNQREHAQALVDMIHRHCDTVLAVVENQFGRAKRDLALQRLPDTALLRIIAATSVATAPRPGSWHTPDFRSINWHGEWKPLTTNQARVVELFVRRATPMIQDDILETLDIKSGSLYQVFRHSWAWKTLIVPGPGKGTYHLRPPENHS